MDSKLFDMFSILIFRFKIDGNENNFEAWRKLKKFWASRPVLEKSSWATYLDYRTRNKILLGDRK